jgi:hypothetical protein
MIGKSASSTEQKRLQSYRPCGLLGAAGSLELLLGAALEEEVIVRSNAVLDQPPIASRRRGFVGPL